VTTKDERSEAKRQLLEWMRSGAGVARIRETARIVARAPDMVVPIALEQAKALTTLGDRPLIVVTAASDPDAGWLDTQDRMTGLSANSAHRVIAAATHDSLISGVDSTTSTQAIMDVIESIRTGTPVQ